MSAEGREPTEEEMRAALEEQMRTSTVPKEWCGRTLHQSCVCSTIECVRTSRSTKSA